MSETDELTKRYLRRIEQNLSGGTPESPELSTRQYKDFKEEYLPKHLSLYEKSCNWSARLLSISPDKKQRAKLEEAIRVCHLETTPEGVTSFSIIAPLLFVIIVTFLGFFLPIIIAAATAANAPPTAAATNPTDAGSLFILLFGVVVGASIIIPLQRLPFSLANNWRMKASNQMVLCTFYIVTYMRHTSNLELAIDFAGEHLAPPLSIDMKKVLWDIETEKYDSIKESLDAYLEQWREWNPEFVESMHLIEGSLLETSDTRRIEMLDKSLAVMLDETYEKMLHYAHNLKSPLTTLHMLGVILPILGLVILPLMVNFIPEAKWYHMALIYDVTLPVLVYVIAKQVLSTRPTGYGSDNMTDLNPELKRYRAIIIPVGNDEISLSPAFVGMSVLAILLVIGFLPLIFHLASPDTDLVYIKSEGGVSIVRLDSESYSKATMYFLEYRPADPRDPQSPLTNGPYGLGALLLSLSIPLALGIGIGIYFSARSRNLMSIREETRKLEQEFASALFQLGNRLADGLPAEIAFVKVSEVLHDTPTGKFFDIVTENIGRMGMSLEQAIFDEKQGAILSYPSSIIESSMKVLVESNKKGPLVASAAVINVSEYIKQMHRVDERLKDLMSEVISSMKSQISFLTPVIAGIVIGISSMISSILGTIGRNMSTLTASLGSSGQSTASLSDFLGGGGIPIYYFQAIVGIYVVEITIILTIMVNGIENGADEIAKQDSLGKNLVRSTILYVAVAAITIIIFSFIAGSIGQIG